MARSGHVYTPSETVKFEREIKLMARSMFQEDALTGPVKVSLCFFFIKPKSVKRKLYTVKPDIDNLIKSVTDALNGILWKDDAQICQISAAKEYGEKEKIHLILEPIEV